MLLVVVVVVEDEGVFHLILRQLFVRINHHLLNRGFIYFYFYLWDYFQNTSYS